MGISLSILEISVVLLGVAVLMIDLWTPTNKKATLGYGAALGLLLVLIGSFWVTPVEGSTTAFGGMFVHDNLALFFKRFFILAAILVLLMSVEFSDRFSAGISEYYSLTVFALSGMMFAASANDFAMLFVSLELITITFYILVSFQRAQTRSLEAGLKYLVLGALSSAFLVYGIAFVYGTSGTMNFTELAALSDEIEVKALFDLGMLLILAGLGFKIAAFPYQIWAPDVYQGAPAPTTAFLAVGSKAAGFVLLLRVLFNAVPDVALHWEKLLMVIAALTILYGNLCAIPQRNIKRLLGYSSIANAGYMLMGLAVMSQAGSTAILYYLAGYLFTVMAAFTVIILVVRQTNSEEIRSLAGLNQRSPILAATLTLAMISLAGIPPLAGFFGKFLLIRAVVEQAVTFSYSPYYWLAGVAVIGIVISIYYYFGVIRAIYWSKSPTDSTPIEVPVIIKSAIVLCIIGMFYLGVMPNTLMEVAANAVQSLQF